VVRFFFSSQEGRELARCLIRLTSVQALAHMRKLPAGSANETPTHFVTFFRHVVKSTDGATSCAIGRGGTSRGLSRGIVKFTGEFWSTPLLVRYVSRLTRREVNQQVTFGRFRPPPNIQRRCPRARRCPVLRAARR